MRQAGFTLLEMLAVLVVISVAFTLLASGVSRGLAGARERQATAELIQSLRQARSLAVFEGRPVALQVDLRTRCYHLEQRPPRCLEQGTELRVETAAGVAGEGAAFAFYPDGSSSGGNLQLSSAARQTRIDVGWLTGSVSLAQGTR